jgi:hypothetical protein
MIRDIFERSVEHTTLKAMGRAIMARIFAEE